MTQAQSSFFSSTKNTSIVGGAAAGGVLIIVVIVAAVLLRRRRSAAGGAAGAMAGKPTTTSAFVNPMYDNMNTAEADLEPHYAVGTAAFDEPDLAGTSSTDGGYLDVSDEATA